MCVMNGRARREKSSNEEARSDKAEWKPPHERIYRHMTMVFSQYKETGDAIREQENDLSMINFNLGYLHFEIFKYLF